MTLSKQTVTINYINYYCPVMSDKQIIWLGIGLVLVTYNPLNLFNGLDLLGWIVLSYTVYRVIEDYILFKKEKAKWQKIILS